MNNSHLSTPDTSRLRRDSKPSPPERDELKKQNTDFSMFDKSVGCRANDIGCVEGGGHCCVLGLVTCICEVKP
jgi:hypothetical protein